MIRRIRRRYALPRQESRKLTILVDRFGSRLRLYAVGQRLKREEGHSQERVRAISQHKAILGMPFFAFLRSRKQVREVDFQRLKDQCPLSISGIRAIRGQFFFIRPGLPRIIRGSSLSLNLVAATLHQGFRGLTIPVRFLFTLCAFAALRENSFLFLF